ncbi:TPA: hypothetical protein ACJJUP_001836, partial [Neisseria meningitidis]
TKKSNRKNINLFKPPVLQRKYPKKEVYRLQVSNRYTRRNRNFSDGIMILKRIKHMTAEERIA